MKLSFKTLVLISLGLFLYSRIYTGTLLFYISERFTWLTLLAAIGLLLVAVSYRYRSAQTHDHAHDPYHEDGHDHEHAHAHEPSLDHADHQHGHLSWSGLLLLAMPVILGLLIPPKPLGAAAFSNRDVRVESLTSVAPPQGGAVLARQGGDKNILDWLMDFRQQPDPAAFADQEAKLIGFVYRDERFGADTFMVSRFVMSCCAADAAPLGLMVQWPESADLALDQWVEVKGRFQPGEFDGEPMPILVAEAVAPTEVPEQPYLYPY